MLVSSAICSLLRPAPDANVNKSEGHYLRWVDLGEGEVADIPHKRQTCTQSAAGALRTRAGNRVTQLRAVQHRGRVSFSYLPFQLISDL